MGNNSNYSGNNQTPFPHYIQYGFLGSYTMGDTYPIEISVSPSSRFRTLTVYIDYDHDGSFGAFEWVVNGGVAPGDTVFASSIWFWNLGIVGNTGMRVLLVDDSSFAQTPVCYLIDPCSSNFMWGEVEDYTIETQSATTGLSTSQEDNIKLFPIPAKRYIQIENNSPIQNAILYSLDGKRLRSPLFDVAEKKLFFNGVPGGVYLLELKIGENIVRRKITIED